MGQYLRSLFASVLQGPLDEKTIKKELRERGCDIRWIDVLHDERITYFHKGSVGILVEKAKGVII
jgi:hypothetical protein